MSDASAPRSARDPGLALPRRGLMLVLSSPSGAGKTTLSRRLLDADTRISLSVSVTTRPRRPGEVQGQDYQFVDISRFTRLRDEGELLEHAKVFGNYYGTPRAPVEARLSEGKDVLFDIDWQGTQQIREVARADLVTVFVLPPSSEELERRLHSRAQDPEEVIQHRMARAADEMSHFQEYDYIIVNYDADRATAQLRHILEAERLKRDRLVGLRDFVTKLQQGL